MKIPVLRTKYEFKLDVAWFDFAKEGSRIYISIKHIYRAIGSKAHGGKSYLWIDHNIEKWIARMERFGFKLQICV